MQVHLLIVFLVESRISCV